ncbi:acyl-CoA thioesterase [Halocatena halophila]|uniref:acyl-CoA thioesterase n=1 Tax=Halocatena halophila TaxID=2814576 RepID=UPI002ED3C4B2
MPVEQQQRATSTLSASYTEMSEILMPNETNNLGRALGGAVLHWMDICGAISGRRFARAQVVTASMDHVDFIAPIELGDIVTITGYVFDTGRTSLDVTVTVSVERPASATTEQAARSFFTFVALDGAENAQPVPALECPTEAQEDLRQEALDRRRSNRRDREDTESE